YGYALIPRNAPVGHAKRPPDRSGGRSVTLYAWPNALAGCLRPLLRPKAFAGCFRPVRLRLLVTGEPARAEALAHSDVDITRRSWPRRRRRRCGRLHGWRSAASLPSRSA